MNVIVAGVFGGVAAILAATVFEVPWAYVFVTYYGFAFLAFIVQALLRGRQSA